MDEHCATAAASSQFALELYGLLAKGTDNLVFSPASVHLALRLALAGAGGVTAEQLASALHLEPNEGFPGGAPAAMPEPWPTPSANHELVASSRIFVEQTLGLREQFAQAIERAYQAGCEALDLVGAPRRSAQRMNAWVNQATHGRVSEVMPGDDLAANMLLVIVNAVYFKAEWAAKFVADLTMPGPFMLLSGESVSVDMMHATEEYRVAFSDGLSVLELPYRGGDYVMNIVLPAGPEHFHALEQQLTATRLARWLSQLERRLTVLELPRFTIDPPLPLQLRESLLELGVTEAFDPGKANFERIARQPAFLQDVVHKTYLTVTEDGTEAAAMTSMFLPQSQLPPETAKFSARHPFLFFVRDVRDETILFAGRVTDPRASG